MSRQFWQESLAWAVADGTAIANTVTETIVFPNTTIPANYMQDGRVLRLKAFGRYSTTATPTLLFRLRWGGVAGTVICASGAMTGGSTVTNALWTLEAIIQTRTNGATGTLFAVLEAKLGAGVASTVGSATGTQAGDLGGSGGVTAPATATVDLTADTALSLTATWGTANASNTLTGHILNIESLN